MEDPDLKYLSDEPLPPYRIRRAESKRVIGAIRQARQVVNSYGVGPAINGSEITRLAKAFCLEVCVSADPMDSPAVLLPPFAGCYHLIISSSIGPAVREYITLHEIGHILTGDADEPTFLRFSGPLPEAEDVVDLFALLGVIDGIDRAEGPEWIEARIRERVPLDNRGWQVHRIPRLSRKLHAFHQLQVVL